MQLWEEMALVGQEAKAEGHAEGHTAGHTAGHIAGRAEGERSKLIKLICKKLRKGLTSEEIAELLEEDLSTVQEICEAAVSYAPDYEEEKVLSAYLKKNNQ